MSRVVVKIGGSNLKEVEDIERVVSVVNSYEAPVVVVSAYFGITNYLIEMLERAKKGESVAQEVYDTVKSRKDITISRTVKNQDRYRSITSLLESNLDRLKNFYTGVSLTGDASSALCAYIESFGERLSAIALCGAVEDSGRVAVLITPEEIGLITDGDFSNASVDFERAKPRVQEALKRKVTYVIPGYYGVSLDGKVTLLGRGGSDYSAASIAKCLEAESVDIWKDVNGFMSADPHIIEESVQIKKLAYTEAAELAYFGAKILHPRTVEPLIDDNISIKLFNINGDLDINNPLSIINGDIVVSKDVIKSVTHSREFGFLKLKGPAVGLKPGILAKVTSALHKAGININSVITSQISINILLSKGELEKAREVVSTIKLPTVVDLFAVEKVSVIAAIGAGLIDNYGVSARIFTAMASNKINVVMSCSGASPVVSYFIVEDEDLERGLRAVHKEFFE